MLRQEDIPAPVLAARLERAATRNAELVVLLRKLIAHLHASQLGHDLNGPWSICPHDRCRRVRQLVEG